MATGDLLAAPLELLQGVPLLILRKLPLRIKVIKNDLNTETHSVFC